MNKLSSSGHKGFRVAVILACGVVGFAASQASGSNVGLHTASLVAAGAVRVGGYDASTTYKGSYEPQKVYRLVLGPQTWRPNPQPAMLRDVTCRDAKRALEEHGVWTGRLGTDGSCRHGDDTEWATGNYLNYQAGPHDTDAGL